MVSIEATDGLERRMTLQLPAAKVDSEVNNRLKSVGKQARIKGFRPGKIPAKVVRQHYGSQVQNEVLAEMMQASFVEAIREEKLNPAGRPRLEPKPATPGSDYEFIATFEVFPEVKLDNLKKMKITRPDVEIGDSDVDAMLDQLRTQRKEWVQADRQAARGDRLIIDLAGTIDGEPFEGGSGEDISIELGSGMLMEKLEEALVGTSAGDSKTVTVPFAGDHRNEAIAGKQAVFDVAIKQVDEVKLPEIDDAFCESFGVTEGGIEALRAEVRGNMEREREEATARRVRDQVISELVRLNPIDVPRALIESEIMSMYRDLAQRLGSADAISGQTAEQFEPEARRRVVAGLLLSEAIRSGNIEPDTVRVNARIASLSSGYDDPEQFAKNVRGNANLMQELEARILEEQAVDWLLDQAKVKTESISFSELMETQAA